VLISPFKTKPRVAGTSGWMKARLIERVFMPVNLPADAGLKITSAGYFRRGHHQFC
jgi:hypothetical protein